MKRVVTALIAMGLVGLFGWYLYGRVTEARQEPQRRRGPGTVAVEVAEVRHGTIRDVRQFTGTLRPNSQFVVAPKIGGRLETLAVNIGDRVDSGDLIATLDSAEYVQQVQEAEAELKVAQANVLETKSALDVAQREFERVKALYDKKIATESELDVARSELEARQAKHQVTLSQVTQRQAALTADKIRLSYTQIQAAWQDVGVAPDQPDSRPRQRVVGERFVDTGAMLKPNDPIVTILDLNRVIAVVHIIERYYADLSVGQEAVVTTDAYPGRHFTGRVTRVAPLLKETSRQARVEVTIDNPDWLLKPGMFVRVELEFAERPNATLVAVAALSRREGKQVLFTADLEKKTATLVPVTVGVVTGEQAEILSPPLNGHVVTLGQHLLSDGSEISVPGETPSTRPTTGRDRGSDAPGDRRGPPGGRP